MKMIGYKGFDKDLKCRDFPTEPPVRRRDDGLSPGVADLSIPWTKWRTESIKALGNAMCPQVVYELFRAIEVENGKLEEDRRI